MEAPQQQPDWSQRSWLHADAAAFFARPAAQRVQDHFAFPAAWDSADVVGELALERGPHCRFCESRPGKDAGDVRTRHFRPFDGVMTDERELLADHYWWLAYERDNLLLVCDDCHSRKGKRFPVRGSRARAETPISQIDDVEMPVLAHPDGFGARMAFGSDGMIGGTDPGARETVSILQLNRPWLVAARRAAYREAAETPLGPDIYDTTSADLYPNTVPHFHVRRQAHQDVIAQMEVIQREMAVKPITLPDNWGATTKSSSEVVDAQNRQSSHDKAVSSADVTDESSFATTRTIERIEIRNFRIIDHLVVDLLGRPGEWRMLLGENGTGKSTLLQAVALALVNAEYRDRLGVSAASCVRHRCKSGWIEVTLAGTDEPIRLEFSTTGGWGGNADAANTQVLGYGATRLLPRSASDSEPESAYARVANMFDPFVALGDAAAWLASQHTMRRDRFDAAARLLRQLLDEKAAAKLRMHEGGVQLCENGVWKGLDELSDGYQTVVALALDMMSVLSELWPDMAAAEGVVLIDELGSHLHPRWQMRIVSSLRMAFPRLQFIVTTHNPLCLRGLQPDEIVMMRRRRDDEKRIVVVKDLPPIDGLRVDQLLTSPHFGLGTTLDADIERDFQRMYELERKAGPTTHEIVELQELERRLAGEERLGDTPAQGAMYRAINRLLRADAAEMVARDPLQLGDAALDEIVGMLQRIDDDRARHARRGASSDGAGILT